MRTTTITVDKEQAAGNLKTTKEEMNGRKAFAPVAKKKMTDDAADAKKKKEAKANKKQ